jgi:hypothetical protein
VYSFRLYFVFFYCSILIIHIARIIKMVLRKLKRIFEPLAIILILAGIFGLIQPFQLGIFRWGFNILWIGLVSYMLFSHFPS